MSDPESGGRFESKSQRKRRALAVQALAERLLTLPAPRLAELGLEPEIGAAIEAARGLRRGAYRRQLRYLARLLRAGDADRIETALAAAGARRQAAGARAERWRERLLEGGEEALETLAGGHPGLDRGTLRRLVRAARRERETGHAPRAARALLRLLRALEEGGGPEGGQ